MMTRTRNLSRKALYLAVPLCGLAFAGFANAQQATSNPTMPTPERSAASCAEVKWDRELLAQYPRMPEGCQEVVSAGGRNWARFGADLVSNNQDGSVTLNFKDRRGRSMDQVTLMPSADQRVLIDGRKLRFTDLRSGEALNVYVPEGMYAISLDPNAPVGTVAAIVKPPVAAVVAPAPEQMARAEVTPSPMARRLPDTAGPLPWLALSSFGFLLSGAGLTFRRRRPTA